MVSSNTATTELLTWPLNRKLVVSMEHTDVSDPLKVRHTLDCIAADINYLNIYSYVYDKYRKQTCSYLCFNSSFKVRFREAFFWLKLLSKKLHYMHLTLKYLIATKDHVFLNKPTPLSSGVFSKYVKPFLPLGIQGLTN